MGFGRHVLTVMAGVLLLLGVPLMCTERGRGLLLSGGADAVSSASVILDQPSGEYVVLINGGMRKNQETLEAWKSFFGGEEIAYIFEDIACSVAAGDAGALEMARSFQSRLPENQMQIRTEDATLLMSRADHGKFDVLIMSKEFSEAYHGETVPKEGLEWISLN